MITVIAAQIISLRYPYSKFKNPESSLSNLTFSTVTVGGVCLDKFKKVVYLVTAIFPPCQRQSTNHHYSLSHLLPARFIILCLQSQRGLEGGSSYLGVKNTAKITAYLVLIAPQILYSQAYSCVKGCSEVTEISL